MPKFKDLIKDIYSLLENPEFEISEDNLEVFSEQVKDHLRDFAGGRLKTSARSTNKLRASKLGLPPRRLWYDIHSPEPVTASDKIRFLYGNLLESLVLLFAKEAGHEVTDEQRRVEVDGIIGHMDCKIDGTTVDVKSASSFSFKKFANGEFLLDDKEADPFGYKSQLGFYMKKDADEKGAFLVINKESGELTSVILNQLDVPDINLKIEQSRINLERDFPPPEKCYDDEARGKSGNRTLHKLCTFCPHKHKCWNDSNDGKGLIEHEYAFGKVYFTKLVRDPRKEKSSEQREEVPAT
jgi:hypothetical protein